MYYVSSEGILKNTDEKVITDELFFCNSSKLKNSMLHQVVKSYSLLHQALNSLIESTYRVNIERVSRTEKNKGGEYSSSSFTITAGLENIEDGEALKKFREVLYTLKGSSVKFLNDVIKNGSKIIRGYFNIDEELLKKDTHLYQKIQEVNSLPSIMRFSPININRLLKDRYDKKFKLDAMDQAIYLGYATKFMEMFANYMLQTEVNYYFSNYEFWLFSLLEKYFNYSLIENLD
jgi:hypothetical protein